MDTLSRLTERVFAVYLRCALGLVLEPFGTYART